jgi:GNAT superfamily N-acetyltransferase
MEKSSMAILLQNLLARAPRLNDLSDVTRLLIACDIIEDGMSDYTEEELLADWQRPAFNLDTDAWVIITNRGQLVGFADLWSSDYTQVNMRIRVHPEFLGRGIGTLLLRFAEHRSRQYLRKAPAGVRVVLHSAVSSGNQGAKDLLEHEGYTPVRQFWRMMIDADESADGSYQPVKLKFDLYAEMQQLAALAQPHRRTGIYIARQYDIYEKELRAGEVLPANVELPIQLVSS